MASRLRTKTVHFGYAHVFPLGMILTKNDFREFEGTLESKGFEIRRSDKQESVCNLNCITRGDVSIADGIPFIVKLMKVGQVQSAESEPVYTLSVIMGENGQHNYMPQIFNVIAQSFTSQFKAPGFVLTKQATLRMLIGALEKPGFQYLWEDLLKQKTEILQEIGVPLQGGGLRFVNKVDFEVSDGKYETADRDFKFESYLKDPRFLFAEGVYNWRSATLYEDEGRLKTAVLKIFDGIVEDMNASVSALLKEGR